MSETTTRAAGVALAAGYALMIGRLYARQAPANAQVTGGLADADGVLHLEQQSYGNGLAFVPRDRFVEARAAFARADPAVRDARTQFYIAYSFYRQGWGRLYEDDALYREGLDAVNRAIALSPNGRLVVDDPDLHLHTADELKATLEAGLRIDASDFSPARVLRERK